MSAATLPAPRLQLRWQENDGNHGFKVHEYSWICHYELVLPLGDGDVRRESCAPKGVKQITELVAPIKSPSARASSSAFPPCTSGDGKQRYYDAPWRDGVHAEIDARLLGGLPVYVIAPDGETFKCPDQAEGGA